MGCFQSAAVARLSQIKRVFCLSETPGDVCVFKVLTCTLVDLGENFPSAVSKHPVCFSCFISGSIHRNLFSCTFPPNLHFFFFYCAEFPVHFSQNAFPHALKPGAVHPSSSTPKQNINEVLNVSLIRGADERGSC